ncbi:hypothetical protein VOLCADRAFT_85900 [Volvox carteri f. nagariensis]|uniref:DUF676 domain-containing protein n=1 Tax=Volvox carteri f. nagariensis TaxID=3068 RepID=D8THA7_VOLCA|nr:uncharacterized protein VOLCADRAFT_85900 [Volvox carteri f. nagariensis]EFJ53038.1 hypothetical protein VOLCADRAFT_85900 [Volvox carteri f. nagariensis]|eukprot:XP_002946043.1 hypothetical protein VOLCADRAFT_85900 [Volvox carteri f. nagariensis]
MIGYSMGGLIIRYVAGKLYAEGVFSRIRAVNFITVATPHLGAWRMPSSWYNRAFNYMVPVVTSRSGYQLVLQDKHLWGKPLLCLMSHPDLLFMQALRQFKKLMLLANVFHDRPVPYCTAAIRLENPYERNLPVAIDPKYPSIVTTTAAAAAAARAAASVGVKPADNVENVTLVTAVAAGSAEPPLPSDPGGTIVEVATAEPAATAPQLPRRPLRSTYLPFLMVVFLPLALPALLLMVIAGRTHHSKIMRTALDFSWIQRYYNPNPDTAAVASLSAPSTETPGGLTVAAAGEVERPVASAAAGGEGGKQGGLPSGIACPSAPDMPERRSFNKTRITMLPLAAASAEVSGGDREGPGTGGVMTAAPASSTALGALDDGADGVVVSEQSVLLHDGIVELPAEMHRVQEWLADQRLYLPSQLNKLPWHKVDVDCRDLHAHAAIIMRNPARFTHNKDVLDYLIDNFLRT